MLPITSQPYRIPEADRLRVGRSLGRGLRPLVLNALVLVAAFVAILWGVLAVMEPVMNWVEAKVGNVPVLILAIVPGLMFAVPWILVYLVWRRIWFVIIRRRAASLAPEPGAYVATVDEVGIRIEEGNVASNWLAWSAVTRLLLVGDTLVVARGTFGLVVSVKAIGGRSALAALTERVSAAAMAASDRSVRDALA